jgi:23S rRNA pseudouridine1911/1915/1917 synthase
LPEFLTILHEDADLLVLNKPADLVCHPSKTGPESSLIGRVRMHLGEESNPQLVNRLDRETSGVVVVAKTAIAARELRRIWESRAVTKEYLAIVHGVPVARTGLIEAPLGKDAQSPVAIKDCVRPDGASATTEYAVEQTWAHGETTFSRLRVWPRTGRKHQIRIHLAHLGHPIVGDKIYGGDERLYLAFVERRLTDEQRNQLILPNHALHAERVRFEWRGRAWEFRAEAEEWFQDFSIRAMKCNPRPKSQLAGQG